jgi:nucleoside-diphosphate-sugar epimerase
MPTPQPLVLVTGSSGYLGVPLVERLLSDYRVVEWSSPTVKQWACSASSTDS